MKLRNIIGCLFVLSALAACAVEPGPPADLVQVPELVPAPGQQRSPLCAIPFEYAQNTLIRQGGRPIDLPDPAAVMRRYNETPPPSSYEGTPHLFRVENFHVILVEGPTGCLESSMKINDRSTLEELVGGSNL